VTVHRCRTPTFPANDLRISVRVLPGSMSAMVSLPFTEIDLEISESESESILLVFGPVFGLSGQLAESCIVRLRWGSGNFEE